MISSPRVLILVLAYLLIVSTAKASFFDDLLEGDFDTIAGKRNIQSWNENNGGKYSIDDAGLGCGLKKKHGSKSGGFDPESYFDRVSKRGPAPAGDCIMTGTLINNTSEIIKAVVIRVKFYNKQTSTLVIEEEQIILAAAVPSVSAEFQHYFDSSNLSLAYKQLGDQYSWSFEIVGAVPKEMDASWLLEDEG